ncbi:MAG: DNA-directed RNA polymerase subunit alpha [Chloroflexi bacterium RBG_16_50_9]|nr:MAG: DNA-directed RNA polymerase subunit alpha [Chloroflexi bacterium RBG_16_50_9]
MSELSVPTIECVECVDNYGRFVAEPLEKGVGITLGNSLRRVLVGYLQGAAVTQVRIEGIQHEFTVIPNAKEDVIEFLLNVKELRLKPLTDHGGTLTLEIQGEGRVCAADIKPSADFEITNPELCLITLTMPDARLNIEFDVTLGTGFKPAESTDNMPVGTLPVDAIFSPIRKINFNVEPTHLGRETSRERLYLEIWTDGTTSPTDALSLAAGILVEQLRPFHEYVRISKMQAEERLIRLSIPDEKYNMPVEQLDLSVRTMNCLRRSNITTVGEIINRGPKELLKLRNFGMKSYQEIEDRLATIGLSLTPKSETEEEMPAGETGEASTADISDQAKSQGGES